MKKIMFTLLLFFMCVTSVQADKTYGCTYENVIDDINNRGTVTFTYSIIEKKITNWRNVYDLGNDMDFKPASGPLNVMIIKPSESPIFDDFVSFGAASVYGSCPVLVRVGTKYFNSKTYATYTLLPYNIYVEYFAPENIIDCPSCGDEKILIKDANAKGKESNFYDFCESYNRRTGFLSAGKNVPIVDYLKAVNPQLEVLEKCKDYNKTESYPRAHTEEFKILLKVKNKEFYYKDYFYIGAYPDENVCPLYNGGNNEEIEVCLEEKIDDISSAIKEFKKKCNAREMAAIQAYSGGSLDAFNRVDKISSLFNNGINLFLDKMDVENCGTATNQLYDAVSSSINSINSYSMQSQITNTLRYMSFESYYLQGYAYLTQLGSDIIPDENPCNIFSPELKIFIQEIFSIFRIVSIVLVIILTIVDVYKMIISGDSKNDKKVRSFIVKRLVIFIVIILIPVIVSVVIDILNQYISLPNAECIVSELE